MKEILLRFLIGGTVVSFFALTADVLKPKSFAGLLGAAPSVALAILSLTILSLTAITPLAVCPTGYHAGASCFQMKVSCPSTADIQVTYGFINPAGIPRGTIALLRGAGGTQPGLGNYAATYR